MRLRHFAPAVVLLAGVGPALAGPFRLMTGVDNFHYPGTDRSITPTPGPGFPRAFSDGDRLAGTSDTGGVVAFQGIGTPLFPPNHAGTLSLLFRRGSIPIPPNFLQPIMGIDFIGGPLLDLDGDTTNGVRSLVPVLDGGGAPITPVEIPSSFSRIDLSFDLVGGTVAIDGFDATGTNEGGFGIEAGIATVLVTLAGTTPTGGHTGPINPAFDMRIGTLAAHTGPAGALTGVYKIQDLPVELWYDSILANSSTAADLGSFQYLVRLRGWLVVRDCQTGLFPVLAGQGLGSTLWPAIDQTEIGNTFNTATGSFGPTATITGGVPGDDFLAPGNGGLALSDGAGDLGAYLDTVVAPLAEQDQANAFVYLEGAGFGLNNSGDPVYADTVGYDVVVIAESLAPVAPPGDVNGDGVVDLGDAADLATALLDPSSLSACAFNRADVNGDAAVDGLDISAFVGVLP